MQTETSKLSRAGLLSSSVSNQQLAIYAWKSRASEHDKTSRIYCGDGASMVFAGLKSTRAAISCLPVSLPKIVSASCLCDSQGSLLTTVTDLRMKEVEFAAEIMTVIEHGTRNQLSIVRFTQERGAASSFYKVVDTMKMVFKARNLLVTDRRKQKMMIKTLNSAPGDM
jgi:hypothetical protein